MITAEMSTPWGSVLPEGWKMVISGPLNPSVEDAIVWGSRVHGMWRRTEESFGSGAEDILLAETGRSGRFSIIRCPAIPKEFKLYIEGPNTSTIQDAKTEIVKAVRHLKAKT